MFYPFYSQEWTLLLLDLNFYELNFTFLFFPEIFLIHVLRFVNLISCKKWIPDLTLQILIEFSVHKLKQIAKFAWKEMEKRWILQTWWKMIEIFCNASLEIASSVWCLAFSINFLFIGSENVCPVFAFIYFFSDLLCFGWKFINFNGFWMEFWEISKAEGQNKQTFNVYKISISWYILKG